MKGYLPIFAVRFQKKGAVLKTLQQKSTKKITGISKENLVV
jgi:hypothetical protein